MQVVHLVSAARKKGYLTPAEEDRLNRFCESDRALEAEEYDALRQLMHAVEIGEILAPEKKHCVNIMEEVVWEVVLESLAQLKRDGTTALPDPGDVAAYALNRLPPLYATTVEGAKIQRQRAREEHEGTIREQAAKAVELGLGQPVYYPEREPIGRSTAARPMVAVLSEASASVPNME